jgi:urease accessory protein
MDGNADLQAQTQARPRLQRARGSARLGVHNVDGASRVARLFQQGSAKVRMSATRPGSAVDAVLINTAGGLAGGDRFDWAIEADLGARCTVITQACEKIYRSEDEAARVDVRLTVGEDARLDWLPQETILFDRARLQRTLHAELAATARLVVLEAVILGRRAMGETVSVAAFRDRWRIRRCGRLIFADNLMLDGDVGALIGRKAVLDGAGAFASLLYAADDAEARVAGVRDVLGAAGGASAFDGKLFCRITARDGMALRAVLIPVLAALREAPLPRLWTT